jgi:hypothetical protein
MKLIDLRESTRWAVGPDQDMAQGWAGGQLRRGTSNLVWINIKDAFANTPENYSMDLNDPSGGKNIIGDRIAQVTDFWARGGFMNPSDASVYKGGRFDWGDGRHRMVVAHQMGEEYGPILIDDESLENLQNSPVKHSMEKPS